MTRNEAKERAAAIWGQAAIRVAPATVKPREAGWVEWMIDLDGVEHRLDENGHTVCHDRCAELELKAAS